MSMRDSQPSRLWGGSSKRSLAETHPGLAQEADGWDPSLVSAGSTRKLAWRCPKGHVWVTAVSTRAKNGSGCPYCSGNRAIPGSTDLATTHPTLAAEAVGWDPTSVSGGSSRRVLWQCERGLQWSTSIAARARRGAGCPFCWGKYAWPGESDLATTHPGLAAEAYGWDPSSLGAGSHKVVDWRCELGHEWRASVENRSRLGTGCPYCSGRRAIAGTSDLATTHPELARQAVAWDPTEVSAGSSRPRRWRCAEGHEWLASPDARTRGSGCPACYGRVVVPGLTDLATTHPQLAAEADGWDPATLGAGSAKVVAWVCPAGHRYRMRLEHRGGRGLGCPYCSGKRTLAGFNDLATVNPKLAAEAVGWDPTTRTAWSHSSKVRWKCDSGHEWMATVGARSAGNGCPTCNPGGFDKSKPGFLYLFERHGEQQTGITSSIKRRSGQHALEGWVLLDAIGPFPGDEAYELEQAIVAWLRREVGTLPGTREAWSTSRLEVTTVVQLAEMAGVKLPSSQ